MKAGKAQTVKPTLILLYGFPGSGKTHFAQHLRDHLQAAHVHGDRIRYELFDNPAYDRQENDIVNHLMDYMSEEFLSAGVSVVYDVNAARVAQRRTLRDMARKHGAKSIVVWFQMDADTAYERTQVRDRRKSENKYVRQYTPDLFNNAISRMQQPKTEDYIVVSGKHVFESQRRALFKKLTELGYIEYKDAQNKVAKPGLINLVPKQSGGRVDMGRRNINIQ